jgi:phosphoglucomutase
MSSALERLKNLTNKISSYELARKNNVERLRELFTEIGIDEKVDDLETLFNFKAINLSGVSLQEDTLGAIQEGKYLQILAISYDKTATVKSKNISLAYFGRVESVDEVLREKIVEFVLRFRFEKSFMTLEHYHGMLERF